MGRVSVALSSLMFLLRALALGLLRWERAGLWQGPGGGAWEKEVWYGRSVG